MVLRATPVITVEVNNDLLQVPLNQQRLRDAVRIILADAGVLRGQISVAVVDDATISKLHGKYLGVDEPTDVLSFVLERGEDSLEGEVIVSADTAEAVAQSCAWTADDELLLYVVHGTLHLVGFEDSTPGQGEVMRQREQAYLDRLGVRLDNKTRDVSSEDSSTTGEQVP